MRLLIALFVLLFPAQLAATAVEREPARDYSKMLKSLQRDAKALAVGPRGDRRGLLPYPRSAAPLGVPIFGDLVSRFIAAEVLVVRTFALAPQSFGQSIAGG
jgi:hypothetical protein